MLQLPITCVLANRVLGKDYFMLHKILCGFITAHSPFKKLVQLHSIHLMCCQYHHAKCIPLLPPIEFGPHHSHDTRTAALFANSKRFRLIFSQIFFVLLHHSGGTTYLFHFIPLLKTDV